jgi:regulatory protein
MAGEIRASPKSEAEVLSSAPLSAEDKIDFVPNAPSPSEGRGKGGGVAQITALEAQQKREGRINVYIDGKFALGLFDDVVLTLGLRIGQQITPERLEEIAQAETRRKAIEDAYNLLSFRSRSEKEITDRLKRKGYEEDIIGQVLEKLRTAGYLNDEAFAQSWATSRGKTLGRRALAHELRQKGVDNEMIAQTLAEVKSDEKEQDTARLVAVRRVGERPVDQSREAKARLAAFLQRRGFGWETIRPILSDLYGVRDGEERGEDTGSDDENSDNDGNE